MPSGFWHSRSFRRGRGKTKSGEPVFIERRGTKPAVFFTDTTSFDGKRFIAKKTDPVAVGVNNAQLHALAYRRGSEVFTKYPHLLNPLMKAVEVGPNPELFLDVHNVNDAENVMVMLGGTKDRPKDGAKLLLDLGVIDEDGTIKNIKPLIALGNWLRDLTGGDSFEGMRQELRDEDIRKLAEVWEREGYRTDISLEELRGMEEI